MAGLFVLAAFARAAYLLVARPPFETLYWALSDGLLRSGSLAIDDRQVTDFEPLYPFFLAISRVVARDHVLVIQLFQVTVASLGVLFMYRLTETLTRQRRLAMIGGALYALDPLLIRQAANASESALFSTLLVAFAYYFVTVTTVPRAALAGVCIGLVVLTRTMALPLVVLGAVILLAERRAHLAVAMILTALVIILPFPVRNHAVNGSLWPTRSGLNLYIGNSPYTAALLPDEDLDLLQAEAAALVAAELPNLDVMPPEQADRAADALLTRRALDYMADRPSRTLGEKALNVLYFFSPRLMPFRVATSETQLVIGAAGRIMVENSAPRPLIEVVAYSASYPFVLAGAIVGVYLRRRDLRRDVMLWCVTATFVIVYVVYFPATRYRAPMSFVLFFYAAIALERGVGRVLAFRTR